MKRLLFFALTALVLASCATTTLFDAEGRQLTKLEQDRITASVVSQRLAQRKYRIFADYMYPQRAPGVRLNDDWGVEVGRDSIGFFLPYFGQVYMADPAKGPGMILSRPWTATRKPRSRRVTSASRRRVATASTPTRSISTCSAMGEPKSPSSRPTATPSAIREAWICRECSSPRPRRQRNGRRADEAPSQPEKGWENYR